MTSAIQSGRGPSLRDTYRVPVVNGASESAPAYGVLQISAATPVGSTTLYTVTKPTGAANAKYLVNTPQALAAGQAGAAGDVYPAPALIIGSPAINQEVGPVAGSWSLSTNGKGFLYVGGLTAGVGYVASKGGATDFPLVRIINTSGLTKPAGTIVGYGTPYAFPPQTIERIPLWYYVAPTANQAYVVTLAAATTGETVDAAPVGVVNVQVYQNTATDEYANVVNGSDLYLSSAAAGTARILWRERGLVAGAGTLGLQWAIVELGAGGGDNATNNLSSFAIVREPAGASSRMSNAGQPNGLAVGTLGKCQLLDYAMTAVPPDPAKGETEESIKIEFASIHLVGCPIGAIILLHSNEPIKPGSKWGEVGQDGKTHGQVWGQLMHATDELYELAGHAPAKVLWLPPSATGGDFIRWDGAECP